MPAFARTATEGAPLKAIPAWDGTKWTPTKAVWAWGWDSRWHLVWTPKVEAASLSFSKSPVLTGEPFNVIASVPAGTPVGAYAVFRSSEGHNYRVDFPTGSTTVTLVGHTHGPHGTHEWWVDFYTAGGKTTFGPVVQTANGRSTVALASARNWVMSSSAGDNGFQSSVIASNRMTVTLGTPSVVRHISLQMSWANSPGWVEYQSWTAPAASQSYDWSPREAGNWQVRVVITHHDGGQVVSNVLDIVCRTKHLQVTAGNPSPVYGQQGAGLVAACIDGCDVGADSHTFWARDVGRGGAWTNQGTSGPDGFTLWNWVPGDGSAHDFGWAETFSDGSTLYSSVASVTPQAPYVPPPTTHTVSGGHCHDIQAGMNHASANGLTLILTGTFYLYTNVEIPANLNIVATGAHFYCNKANGGDVNPGQSYNAGRFVNARGAGTGGYNHAGWFTWDGGTFDGNGEGIFTISHAPGFTIKNATLYRHCADMSRFSWGDGHAIEINACGGPDNKTGIDGTFNVQILSCRFGGSDIGQRANTNDEPLQWDWSWEGSGGASPHDGTMCHNILVDSCTFQRLHESGSWVHPPCGVGGHDPSKESLEQIQAGTRAPSGYWEGAANSTGKPKTGHNHIKVSNCVFHGATGVFDNRLSFDKGAIHLHRVRDGWAVNNQFFGCASKPVTAWSSADAAYCSASGNTANVAGSPNAVHSGNS
jgi:hypothetical protein